MKIKIPQNLLTNPSFLIRRCGYARIKNRNGEFSYVRRLRGYRYPRFHIYIKDNYFNLHLDQKAPIYNGQSAHNADYEGEVIEKETERIKQFINNHPKQ